MQYALFSLPHIGRFKEVMSVSIGKRLLMNDPATVDAIQKIAVLTNVHHVAPVPGTQQTPTAAATALLSGQVAMAMDGT